jgi:hypothetical protein
MNDAACATVSAAFDQVLEGPEPVIGAELADLALRLERCQRVLGRSVSASSYLTFVTRCQPVADGELLAASA